MLCGVGLHTLFRIAVFLPIASYCVKYNAQKASN